jgi:hypothetical protein
MTTQVESYTLENPEHRKLALELLGALKGLRYGTLEVTIHDGRVVQIDRHDRRRFPVLSQTRITESEQGT